ncbi:MAG: hypothetical protein Q8P67_24950 [archaeon]|nr:hypothetical protein [archaeon]
MPRVVQWRGLLFRIALRSSKLKEVLRKYSALMRFVIVVVNNRLVRRLLPVALQARWFRLQQYALRLYLYQLLTSLPPTGLYQREITRQSLEEFAGFCRHVREVHSAGPRSQLLLEVSRHAEEVAAKEPLAWELLELAEYPQEQHGPSSSSSRRGSNPSSERGPPKCINFRVLRSLVQELSPGENYTRWQKMTAFAEKRIPPATVELMREGMMHGSSKQKRKEGSSPGPGRSPRATLSPEEAEAKIRSILRAQELRNQQSREKAREYFVRHVESCPAYLRYRRVMEIWQQIGFAQLDLQFSELDQEVGTDRVQRGSRFEEEYETLVFQLICGHLRRPREGLSPMRSLFWVDELGKEIGEVDLTIFDRQRSAVALCEFKTSYYELAAAQRQCLPKMERGYGLYPQGSGGNGHPVTIDEQALMYTVTTIPSHSFLQGAEPKVIAEVAKYIYNFHIDLTSVEQLRDAVISIRQKLDLAASPHQTLLDNWSRIFILL